MNNKIIGSILTLVLITQIVMTYQVIVISNKISSMTAQQTSIISKVNQVAAIGGSARPNNPVEPTPSGFQISYDTFYLNNQCTTTTVTFDDVSGAITNVTTVSGTTNGDSCVTSIATTNGTTGTNLDSIRLKNGVVTIPNSSNIIKSQLKLIRLP